VGLQPIYELSTTPQLLIGLAFAVANGQTTNCAFGRRDQFQTRCC